MEGITQNDHVSSVGTKRRLRWPKIAQGGGGRKLSMEGAERVRWQEEILGRQRIGGVELERGDVTSRGRGSDYN